MSFVRSILFVGFAVVFASGCVRGVEVDFSRLSEPTDKDGGSDANTDSDANPGDDEGSDGGVIVTPDESDSDVPPVESICGNRVVEEGEECDDGNDVSGDGCDSICETEEGFTCPAAGGPCEACGNGVIEGKEACDDGNRASGDGCNELCKIEESFVCLVAGSACEECGDGVIGIGEVCDDGNRASGDGCNKSCTFVEPFYTCPEPGKPCEKCGDGVIDKHEACDDGNAVSGDGCNAYCTAKEDGFVCDADGKVCKPKCGDSFIVAGETCDDGKTNPGDGCDSNCQLESGWTCPVTGIRCIAKACGDGIIAGDEQCEDGNVDANDGCDAACRLEDGYVCKTVGQPCTRTVCNDGVREGSEACDDGNDVIGDGCNPFCELEPSCGPNGCKSSCGDGMMLVTDHEACDDGNTSNHDGCSSDCQIEPGYKCTAVTAQLPDTLLVPITYRDFISLPKGDGIKHPDFESYWGNYVTPGLVADTLGSDGKPVYMGICGDALPDPTDSCPYRRQTTSEADFNQWYRDISGVNITSIQRLPLKKKGDDSYNYPATFLFPLDGTGWVALGREDVHSAEIFDSVQAKYVDDGLTHNFGFTSELRYWFEFNGGGSLIFSGDDDVWVFINRRLALDLGGLHPRNVGTITIDSSGICNWSRTAPGGPAKGTVDLGLTAGQLYEIVLFHAERHTPGSNFTLTIKGFEKAKSSCATVCGDGVVTRDELCDDGVNDGSYGGCMPNCQQRGPFCGDGKVDAPKEQCDDGVRDGGYGGYNQCASGCVLGPRCGDGHKDVGYEQCDDGNTDTGDGCNSKCHLERCGNGVVEAGEQCDDGNTTAGDGCSPRCDSEICGNGWLDPGEACDDGVNDGGYDECAEGCVLGPHCGDGHIDDNEGCDDGNKLDGDRCSADCRVPIE